MRSGVAYFAQGQRFSQDLSQAFGAADTGRTAGVAGRRDLVDRGDAGGCPTLERSGRVGDGIDRREFHSRSTQSPILEGWGTRNRRGNGFPQQGCEKGLSHQRRFSHQRYRGPCGRGGPLCSLVKGRGVLPRRFRLGAVTEGCEEGTKGSLAFARDRLRGEVAFAGDDPRPRASRSSLLASSPNPLPSAAVRQDVGERSYPRVSWPPVLERR